MMNRDLQAWLHVLKSGSVDEKVFRSILGKFIGFTLRTEGVAANREDVATVYCQLLSACQILFEIDTPKKLPMDVRKQLLTAFNNIQRLYIETDEKERRGSYVRTIWFLSELKTKASEGRTGEFDHQLLGKYAKDLLDIFNDIRFVFDIEDENGLVFPISKVIASVVSGRNFQEFKDGIKPGDICTLQLAVKLFQSKEDELILDTLKTQCNLVFIDYLKAFCEIIDTVDFLNYQYNGTVIFYDDHNRKVLIRSEREGYFSTDTDTGYKVNAECDCDGKTIGWFVEYALESYDRLCDYSDCLNTEYDRIEFLRLLYDKGFKNIFLQNSIVRKRDNSFIPINPYCRQDMRLIQGRLRRKAGKDYQIDQIRELLQRYRVCSVKSSAMNRVTFGLCLLLLEINNVGIDALELNSLSNDRWYQEQVIEHWVNNGETDADDVTDLLGEWYRQLNYLESQTKLEQEQIHAIDFLPLQQHLLCAYRKLCPSILADERPIFGKLIEDEQKSYTIEIDLRANLLADNHEANTRFVTVTVDNLQNDGEIDDWESKIGTDIWFFYSFRDQKGHIISRTALKALHGVESILMKCLSYSVGSDVTEREYEKFSEYVQLFKEVYRKVAKTTKVCGKDDIESQIYLRILHNMIWSKIVTIDKKRTYIEIVFAHQLADYVDIDQDSAFLRSDENVLYIPKDSFTQGAVLSKLYAEDLTPVGRDTRNLYNIKLTQNEDGQYMVFGKLINRIILLTDNIVSGGSTRAAISAYLDIDCETDHGRKDRVVRIEQANAAMQKYYCDDQEVSIRTILERNSARFSVYAYYGTETGRESVDRFLEEIGIAHDACKYALELNCKADDSIISRVKGIWGECRVRSGLYLYMRKYNMPKLTVFPDKMIEDPELFITLFYKNKEL